MKTAGFSFERREELPRLSWCARARPGSPVLVRHGADVEVRAEGFVEGAWDGEFDRFDFDRAEVLAGSGGRTRDGAVVFAAPFHPLERLFVLRGDREVLLSNSLAFLLTEADDGLDLNHPTYFFDLVRQVRRGIAPPAAWLPTASGRRVELFPCCNLILDPRLSLSREAKPLGPPPASYADYAGRLIDATIQLAANAASPARGRTYRLVAACSRGYDSTAAAAVASRAGCLEGVTFGQSNRVAGHPVTGVQELTQDDSGADALRALGMRVTTFDRARLSLLPGHPRAEFYINSPAANTDSACQLMADTLRGSVFVSGRNGERYWGRTSRNRRRDLREVDDCHLSGHALGEFRLRVGFVHYPLPYAGALHAPAIFGITHAADMQPWTLARRQYNRPIPRRLAEEAGVPRECFGQVKMGAGIGGDRELGPESQRDFDAFVAASVPAAIRGRLDTRPYAARVARHRRLAYLRTNYAHWPGVGAVLDALGTDRLHAMWNAVHLYQFHWGFEKIRGRYRT